MTNKPTQKYETVTLGRKTLMINNFLGGISWALGTTIGLTVVLAIGGFILREIGIVPIVGEFVLSITDFVTQNRG